MAKRPTYVRDGLSLILVGVLVWALTPIAGYRQYALPGLLVGLVLGVLVIVFGYRSARRAELLGFLFESVGPLLAVPGRGNPIRVSGWTLGWPTGRPKKIRMKFGTGQVKLADEDSPMGGRPTASAAALGDKRWAGELAKRTAAVVGGYYKVAKSDPMRHTLILKLSDPPADTSTQESAPVMRAKKIANELLAGTASFGKVETDPESGEVTRLEVAHEVGSKLAAAGYRTRVERTVSVMLPGRWRARWDMEGDRVTFEVRPHLPDSLWIPPLEIPEGLDPLKDYREVRIPYGVDEDGEVISWRPAVVPQFLLTGGTGSGKTSTGHGILAQMTQFGWPVWVADGKGIEFLAFQDWPNVQIVASTIQQQIAVIHRAWALMEYRYDLVQKRQARTEDFEPLLLFIDEFTDMKANLLAWYPEVKEKSAPRQPRTFEEIGSIARKGRTARVHMVLAMQRPDASILTGEVRENFGQRMSMGPLSPQAAEMMWANQVTGVALPRGKTGRATSFNSAGVPVEMQAYRVPDPGGETPGTPEYELLEKLRPAEVRHERMLIIPPEIDWTDDGDPIPVGFSDYQKAEWVWAKDRPDLDPLEQLAAAGAGGVRSSAAAMFGLDGQGPALRAPTPISVSFSAGDEEYLEDEQPLDDYAAGDVLEGYSAPTPTPVSTLSVGDLIRVDEETEAWAVVEEEPVEDFDNPESLVISWRDDMDESGQLIVSASAFVLARKPQGEW